MQGAVLAPCVLCDRGKWHIAVDLFGAEHELRVISDRAALYWLLGVSVPKERV